MFQTLLRERFKLVVHRETKILPSRDLDRPVFDKTGLDGSYRIALEWAREGDGPSIFTAVQAQLGLRLEAAKAPIEVLALDHAERVPTEN